MRWLHLRRRPDPEWENHCHQCGLCCYEREPIAGGVHIDLSQPCPYLDTQKGRCTVYDQRFQTTALCSKLTLFHAKFSRRMPLTCGYVQHCRTF